jgi:hypothetical protein
MDVTWHATLQLNGPVRDVSVQPDGRLLVAGRFTRCDGVARNHVVRLDANGNLDAGFDPGLGPDEVVRGIRWQPGGWAGIDGEFRTVNGRVSPYLGRLRTEPARLFFEQPVRLEAGSWTLRLVALPGSKAVIGVSDDLREWTALETNVLSGNVWDWPVPGIATGAVRARFYRAWELSP